MASKNWNTPASGSWTGPANWSPTGPPTAADDATITGPTQPTGPTIAGPTLTGPGAAATATFLGAATLAGSYAFSALRVGTATTQGQLTLAPGTTLATTTASLVYGPLTVTGPGTRLTISGALSLGGRRTATGYDNPTLAATLGATVQAANLVLTPSTTVVGGTTYTTGLPILSVDATSSIEVGTLGGAAPGKITIDAGRTLAGAGSIGAGGRGIVDNGTILATGGALTLADPVTGTGTLQVGAGATLNLASAAPSSVGIALVGAGATLTTNLATSGVANATTLTAAGPISGFVLGDVITVFIQTAVTAVAYSAGTTTAPGTLTLKAGNSTVGTLRLAGDFTGRAFAVAPSTTNTGAYDITLTPTSGNAGTASPGTATPDAYLWTAPAGGGWNDAVDWSNTTTGATPAPVAPGINNPVTLAGPATGPAQTIYGPGNAASLTLTGATNLNGTFRTGALAIGTAATPGALNLVAGTTLAATAATLLYGPLTATGPGTRLTIAGTLALGGTRTGTAYVNPTLAANGGAAIQAAALTLAPALIGTATTGASGITIDATSTIEIGSTGGASQGALTPGALTPGALTPGALTPGALTIDTGSTLSGAGTLAPSAGLVDNGTVIAQGGELVVSGGVRGSGSLRVAAGAALTLASGTSFVPVAFTGAAGALTVTASTFGLNQLAAISGFAPGDRIGIATSGAAVTAVTYQATTAGSGLLSLRAGTTLLGSLALSGDYASAAFSVAPRTGAAATYDVSMQFVAPDPLFNAAYYLAQNPDIAATGTDPYRQFMAAGWQEGRNPGPWFDTAYYLAHNPDIAAGGANPLTHFENAGWREGRAPSAGFDVRDYLAANPDVAAAGIDPLLHYVVSGAAEGRAAFTVSAQPADPMVDAAYYYLHNPDVRAAGVDATAHYFANGAQEARNPDAWFDSNYYLTQNPDVAAAGLNPLLHFEANGWREGRQPSLVFDDAKYLAAYPDIAAANIDPLLHYLRSGRFEGRTPAPAGGTAPADPLIDPATLAPQLGATLIPTGPAAAQQAAWLYANGGWQKGLNPDPLFDTAYYLAQNPDVAAAHVNPLLHYETNGWHEGRDPSAQFSTTKYLAAYTDIRQANLNPLLHYLTYGQAEARSTFPAA